MKNGKADIVSTFLKFLPESVKRNSFAKTALQWGVGLFEFLYISRLKYADAVNLCFGDSHMRYALFKNQSTNHAYLDRLRKSELLADVYGVWTYALVYKMVTQGLPAKVLEIIFKLNSRKKINLYIFAGEIDIRFHCASEGKISGKELAIKYIRVLSKMKSELNLNSVHMVMPIPPNTYIENETKINGSFSQRLLHYNSFRDIFKESELSGFSIIEFDTISDQVNGLPKQILAKDRIHLNEKGLAIVRQTLKNSLPKTTPI